MDAQIIILTAPVNFGKSSTIKNWIGDKTGIGGILALDIDELRCIFRIRDGEYFDFQIHADQCEQYSEEEIVSVGKFHFLKEGFDRAQQTILEDVTKDMDYIVIDELGKLELKNLGLYNSITTALKKVNSGKVKGKLIIVIRDYLLKEALEKFNLEGARIIQLGEERVIEI